MNRRDRIFGTLITCAQVFILAIVLAIAHGGAGAKADGSFDITGTVTDPSGNAIAGAMVYATDPGGSTIDYGPVTTQSGGSVGTYDLPISLAGTYDIHFVPPNGDNYNSVVDSNVVVMSSQTIDAQFTNVTHIFSGKLTDSSNTPIANITLKLSASDGNTASAVTDSNGNFSITAMPDQYMLSLDNYSGTPFIEHVVGNIHQLLLSQTAAAVDLTNSDVTQNLVLNLASIHVTVEDGSGAIVPNVPITAFEQVRNPSAETGATQLYPGDPGEDNSQIYYQSISTGADGTADVTSVEGLIYDAGFESPGPNYSYLCATVAGDQVCLPSPATVTGNTSVVLRAPTTHTFSGKLTDGSGNPIAGITVKLTASDGNSAHAVTDPNGNFSTTATPDLYALSVDNYSGTEFIQHVVGNIHQLLLSQTAAAVDLTNSDVTQNLELDLATVHVTVEDYTGAPVPNAPITAYEQVRDPSSSTGVTQLYSADPGEDNSQIYYQAINTDANGNVNVTSVNGLVFEAGDNKPNDPNNSYLCATISGNQTCLSSPVTVSGSTNVTIEEAPPAPAAPTNLTIPSPSQNPVLTWDSVSGATSYNIYRDGTKIDSSATNSYTDNIAPEGSRTYYVTAVNSGGESPASNSVTVLVDRTPPTITYSLSPAPNSSGWNNGQVTVTFNCSDNSGGSGLFSCTVPQTLINEGANQQVTGTAVDNAGNSARVTATINIDETAPTLGTPSWSANPETAGSNSTLRVPVSDALSGVVGGDYYIGSTDPGQGSGTSMTFNGGNLTASIGASLSPGTYNVNVRAQDAAGNWSPVTTTTLTVNPAIPGAPANLTISSPTAQPVLSWSASTGATSYNIYRDGTKIGTSSSASYTDTTSVVGNHSFYVTATNVSGESSASNIVNVFVGTAPAIVSASADTVSTGTAFNFTVNTSGVPSPSVSESGTLPSGVTFTDNGDGTATLAGTVSSNGAGTYSLAFTANNGIGSPATQNFTLIVVLGNSAPQVTSANSATEAFGSPFNFMVTTTGYPAPSLTESGTLPAGVTFTDNGNGTAAIAGTPSGSALGNYSLTITATNSLGSSTQTFTLTITKAPVIKKISNKTARIGKSFSMNITATGTPTASIAESGTLPSGLSFTDNGNGTAIIAGTAATGTTGSYIITITATNTYGSSSQSFTLKVR